MKIGIIMTSYGHIEPDVHRNHISVLLHWSKQFDIQPYYIYDVQQHEALKTMVDCALADKCDFLFFMEHDNTYCKEHLSQLVTHDLDVVTGYYTFRNWPFVPIPLIAAQDGSGMYRVEYIPDGQSECLLPVTIGCFGCCLVKASVFEKLKRPFFRYEYVEEKATTLLPDVCFFNDVREAGFIVYVDGLCRNGHQAPSITLTADNYRIYQHMMLLGFPEMVKVADRLPEDVRRKKIKELGLLEPVEYVNE